MSYQMIENFTSGNSTPAAQVARVFGIARVVKGFTEHWWGAPNTGLTFEGVISWLCRPGGNTSAHYVVDGKGRRVACIVSPFDAAWHSGSALGNATTVGIENNPNTEYLDETHDVSAELIADLRDPNMFGDQYIYGHSHWSATRCPGHIDINRIDALSYQKIPGAKWGDVRNRTNPVPPPPTPPEPVVVPPTPPAPVEAEWVRNIKDIDDLKLQVLPGAGVQVFDLNTMQALPDSIIPRGTWVDVAKETTVGGKKFYITKWAASALKANGILASELGVPAEPPVQEKPEWLKNLQDIADKDMWTRSSSPVLNLADGKTAEVLPINTKVRVTHATTVLGQNLLVLEGGETCIETVYLSDTELTDPLNDIKLRLTVLEDAIAFFKVIWKAIVELVNKHKEG